METDTIIFPTSNDYVVQPPKKAQQTLNKTIKTLIHKDEFIANYNNTRRGNKERIANDLIATLREQGGRVLQYNPHTNTYDHVELYKVMNNLLWFIKNQIKNVRKKPTSAEDEDQDHNDAKNENLTSYRITQLLSEGRITQLLDSINASSEDDIDNNILLMVEKIKVPNGLVPFIIGKGMFSIMDILCGY